MTKTIVIGSESQVPAPKKAIKFVKLLTDEIILDECFDRPKNYKFVELICLNYGKTEELNYEKIDDESVDLMFAYNDKDERSTGALYIGHWNDGVVE